jgi:hypothetical protein
MNKTIKTIVVWIVILLSIVLLYKVIKEGRRRSGIPSADPLRLAVSFASQNRPICALKTAV